jgi:hypothetical protein
VRTDSVYLEFQPDLVLLDLMMPHLDGVAVMEQLRPLCSGVHLPGRRAAGLLYPGLMERKAAGSNAPP